MNKIMTIAIGYILSFSANAQIYKWVDEKGKSHYSQSKPITVKKNNVKEYQDPNKPQKKVLVDDEIKIGSQVPIDQENAGKPHIIEGVTQTVNKEGKAKSRAVIKDDLKSITLMEGLLRKIRQDQNVLAKMRTEYCQYAQDRSRVFEEATVDNMELVDEKGEKIETSQFLLDAKKDEYTKLIEVACKETLIQ